MRRRAGWRLALVAVLLLVVASSARAAPLPGTVHFTAAADFSASTNAAAVMDTIRSTGSDLTLALGDLSYGAAGQEQAWCDFVSSRVGAGYPFQLVSGNHESNGLNGNINDFSACLPNQLPGVVGTYGRQYYVDVPADQPLVRFIMISPALTFPDGTYGYAAGSPRYLWTTQAIDGARAESIPWVVVGMHKPCLTIGRYSCDIGADLLNLLLAKRVDLVLSGHEHTYQRSKQLALGAGCAAVTPNSFNPACVADSDTEFSQGAGSVLAVVGLGGNSPYAVDNADPEAGYVGAASGANQNPTWGVLDVSATADTLRASYARAAGGTFTDSFTISRSQDPDPPPGPITYADDAFSRTVSDGFGSAPTGGPWTVTGASNLFAVAGGFGTIRTGAGSGPAANLATVSAASSDLRLAFQLDKQPTGSGLYLSAFGRRTSAGGYFAKARITSSGAVSLELDRRPATGAEVVLQPATTITGLTHAAGDTIHLRLQTVGSSPTTVRAKVWKAGTAEPAGWQVSTTDNTGGLQVAGSVGLSPYLSSGATNAPITLRIDQLTVTAP
jgi:hypothetical protein